MDEKENKRLKRLLVVSIVLNSALIVAIAAFGSYQLSHVRSEIASIKTDSIIPKDGKDGLNGVSETIVTYLPSKDGKDGKDASDEQVRAAVENYMALHPVKDGKDGRDGHDGIPGAPGLVLFVRQNVLGLWECRFGDDLGWSPIEECG